MPSAVRDGLLSVPRNCERKPAKPHPAATTAATRTLTVATPHRFRGGAEAMASGWLVNGPFMAIWRSLVHWSPSVRYDGEKRDQVVASAWSSTSSFDVVEVCKQREPGRPGCDR